MNFKEYFFKKLNLLKEGFNLGELMGDSKFSQIGDTSSEINDALSSLSNAQRGDLIGECINIFRDTNTKSIEVHIPGDGGLPYQITYTDSDKQKNPHGRKAINITKSYINKFFKPAKINYIIEDIILDVHRGNGESKEYRFASAADPALHKITSDMINKREKLKKTKEWTTSKNSYQRLKDTKERTGEFNETKVLTLKTTQTGSGVSKAKRGNLMDVGRSGRKTKPILNYYYLDSSVNYCVEIGDGDAYAICIKRDNNDLSDSANQAFGTINNVYFVKKSAMDGDSSDLSLFLSADFLQHLTSTLSLSLSKISQFHKQVSADNSSKRMPTNFTPFIGVPEQLKEIDPEGYKLITKIGQKYKAKIGKSRDIVIPKTIYSDIMKTAPFVIQKINRMRDKLLDDYNS